MFTLGAGVGRGDPSLAVLGLPKAASFGVSDLLLSFLLSMTCPCLSSRAHWYSSADCPGCGLAEAGSWPACHGCVIPMERVLASAGRCCAYPAVLSSLCLG